MRSILGGLLFFMASQGLAAEYLVKYKDTKAFNAIHELAAQKSAGLEVKDLHEAGSYLVVDIRDDAKSVTAARLAADPGVEWMVPNIRLHAFEPPVRAEGLREQWANVRVNAQQAWSRAGHRGNKSIVVAVIDTGVDSKHQSLARNMVPGFDFKDNDADAHDEVGKRNPGHGTHCGGIIAADGQSENGIVGLAPNISLMPIRFLGADGSGDLNNGIKSIDFAIEKGARVISASWGASVSAAQAKPLIEAVKRANDKGVIFVVAAANDGKNNDVTSVYPANANFENTITVAASSSMDAKPSWSNYGKATVHVAAPGENIMSTLPSDKYGNLSGTSMATPLVSGLVALLLSQDPTLTGAQIKALLQTTGAKVAIETACNCRVDAFAAVDHLMAKKMWMVPAAASLPAAGTLTLSMMNGQAPFTFASSNPAVLTVDAGGVVTAMSQGTATVTATDASGATVTSSNFHVGKGSAPGKPPEEVKPCPYSPKTCERICKVFPNVRWCKQ